MKCGKYNNTEYRIICITVRVQCVHHTIFITIIYNTILKILEILANNSEYFLLIYRLVQVQPLVSTVSCQCQM